MTVNKTMRTGPRHIRRSSGYVNKKLIVVTAAIVIAMLLVAGGVVAYRKYQDKSIESTLQDSLKGVSGARDVAKDTRGKYSAGGQVGPAHPGSGGSKKPGDTATPSGSVDSGEPGDSGGSSQSGEGSGSVIAKSNLKGVSYTNESNITSTYHVWSAHIDTAKPIGLLMHMHGDGAWEYNNPDSDVYIGGSTGILEQARKRNMVLIVPKSPDTSGVVTWWEEHSRIISWMRSFSSSMLDEFSVDRSRVWYTGFSGGAEFISYYGLPYIFNWAGVTGGGAVIMGGGGSPASYLPTLPKYVAGSFPLYWYVGENDDGSSSGDGFNALQASSQGEAYYRSNGWATSRSTVPGYEHTMTRQYGRLIDEAMNSAGFTGS